jgi:hypothetical protein
MVWHLVFVVIQFALTQDCPTRGGEGSAHRAREVGTEDLSCRCFQLCPSDCPEVPYVEERSFAPLWMTAKNKGSSCTG